jgi:hypothetical protein
VQVDIQVKSSRASVRRASNHHFSSSQPCHAAGVERQQHQKGNTSMAPASQWAWAYSMASTVEDLHRDHAGLVGDVAADHQHHAEFAHGMGEAEDAGGDETGRASGSTT